MRPALTYILIALLALAISQRASAQKIAFVDTSNFWLTGGGSDGGCEWVRTFRFSIDSVIYGITYKKVRTVKIKFGVTTASCTADIGNGYFVREDRAAGLVYYRQPALGNQERILYNYNLVAGDSIQYPNIDVPGATIADSVVTVDSILIGGVYHKVFDFQNKEGRGLRAYSVIEGVGCVNSPLYPVLMSTCGDYFENLRCFSQSGLVQDFNMRLNSCPSLGHNFYINCDVYPETTNLTDLSSAKASIYPNPANSEIQVTYASPVNHEPKVSVYDVLGRCVFSTRAIQFQPSTTINTASWADGIYLVIVRDNNELLQKEVVNISH